MDKLELIKRLTESNPQLSNKDMELAVKVMLDAMCDRLAKGGRIEIRGFGSFSLGLVKTQQTRNAITVGKSKVPMKYVPQFKPAKELKQRVEDGKESKDVKHKLIPVVHVQMSNVLMHSVDHAANRL